MLLTRRELLIAAAGMLAAPYVRAADRPPLRILVLGGTGFLGPHFVNAARANGHQLTLFNRGKTNPGLFKDIEQIHGDRRKDVALLADRDWDAVFDTSAYFPGDVTSAAAVLGERIKQYVLVSTISVYARIDTPGMDETAPLATTDDPEATAITGENYGALKALCEQAANAAMPGKVAVIRPGLLVGPGDTSDRFTYWPVRVRRGGDVLAPGTADDPVQCIDARDIAAFALRLIEQRTFGTFNGDAAPGALTMGTLLETCRSVAKSAATLHWVPADFLASQGVQPWSDMPVWIPARGDEAGFGRVSVARALDAGLQHRPFADTVRDTLQWWDAQPEARRTLKAGISPEREAAVLAAWAKREAESR